MVPYWQSAHSSLCMWEVVGWHLEGYHFSGSVSRVLASYQGGCGFKPHLLAKIRNEKQQKHLLTNSTYRTKMTILQQTSPDHLKITTSVKSWILGLIYIRLPTPGDRYRVTYVRLSCHVSGQRAPATEVALDIDTCDSQEKSLIRVQRNQICPLEIKICPLTNKYRSYGKKVSLSLNTPINFYTNDSQPLLIYTVWWHSG